MKIHKITPDRIYFVMDSGAYGSIARKDIIKLRIANTAVEPMEIDGRRGGCIVEGYMKNYMEMANGSSSLE